MRRSIKLTLITLLIAILPLSATSCTSSSPQEVVEGFLNAVEAKNAEAMTGYLEFRWDDAKDVVQASFDEHFQTVESINITVVKISTEEVDPTYVRVSCTYIENIVLKNGEAIQIDHTETYALSKYNNRWIFCEGSKKLSDTLYSP